MIDDKLKDMAINYGISIEEQSITKQAGDGYGAIDFLAGAAVGGGLGALAGEVAERSAKNRIINVLQKAIDNLSKKKIGKGAYIIGVPLALAGGLYAKGLGNSRRADIRMRRSYQ